MFQDPNLPWGVTSSDTDGYDPTCGNCGHLYSDHYETDEELDRQQFNYKKELVEELLNSIIIMNLHKYNTMQMEVYLMLVTVRMVEKHRKKE